MINKITIIGRLGRDPDSKQSERGASCSFSVAVTENWNSNGERKEHTEWFNISAFGKLAENCSKYLSKGSLAYIEGKLRQEKYTGKDGTEKLSVKVYADTVKFLSSKSEVSQNVTAQAQSVTASLYSASETSIDDDDIPL